MEIDEALSLLDINARAHAHRSPTPATLHEEMAEYTLALRGKHADHPALELVQMGGTIANLLRGYDYGEVFALLLGREEQRKSEAPPPDGQG